VARFLPCSSHLGTDFTSYGGCVVLCVYAAHLNKEQKLSNQPSLARHLGLATLILYGIGDILGAGIYALVGKVAGMAGQGAWISFLLSGMLALITGLSYAELSSRIPHSAGAAAYASRAFAAPLVPFLVGVLVLASGITSAATASLAFHGYLSVLLQVPQLLAAVALIVLINFISFWGIRESARTNNVLTLLEITGLVCVVGAGAAIAFDLSPSELGAKLSPSPEILPIVSGAALAFFAFVGFEDLVNLAGEAKDPRRDLPRAILVAVGVSSVLYLLVVLAVLCSQTPEAAAASPTALIEVLRAAGFPLPDWGFAPIALVAVLNTGLANCIMASRLLYGMGTQRLAPAAFTRVHTERRTPWVAIVTVTLLGILFVLTGGVTAMAQTTSLLLIVVFFTVHLSLIVIRRAEPAPEQTYSAPGFNPWLGLAVSLSLAVGFPVEIYLRGALVIVIGVALYFAYQLSASRV